MLRPGALFVAALATAAVFVGVLVAVKVWPGHQAALSVTVNGTTVYVDTAESSRAYVEYGPTRAYGLFSAESSAGRKHRVALIGLEPGTRYHVRALALSSGRTRSGTDLIVSVPRVPVAHSLRVVGDRFELDGRPWVPAFTWGSCATSYAAEAAVGIDAFMSSNCGDSPEQQARAAFQVGGVLIPALDQVSRALPTTVATYYGDEPDLTRVPPAQLTKAWNTHANAHGIPTFLTLSHLLISAGRRNHALDAAYARLTDALGVDIYPIATTGDPNQIGEVATAQQALRALAGGKPTFQWIEATLPAGDSGSTPTTAQIEAEAWMAIVNGARALGWWTNGTSPFSVNADGLRALRDVNTAIDTFTPAIDAPAAPVTLSNGGVDVFGTQLNGALTVFAVNTSPVNTASETFTLPGLNGRPVRDWNTDQILPAVSGDTFADTLPPLAWRIYVIAPG
ncbi:MAG TPA: hypothetical protein VNY33_04500 [Gaiellaceae bacterium]|jgi:hypothetical protein|nr:hypothetical protein [Gaiellaceae bacterium]